MNKPDKTNTITAVVIDDEPDSIRLLEGLISELPEVEQVYALTNPVEGLQAIKEQQPDILFLDMEMPALNGVELLKIIQSFQIHIHVIVISAYHNLILEAAHFGIIDFLHKPFVVDDLQKCIDNYFNHVGLHGSEQGEAGGSSGIGSKIRIPTSFEDLYFNSEEISYLEADGAYTQIHLANDQTILSSFHLKRIHSLLPKDQFIRISRKHIINYAYLFKIDKKSRQCLLNHQVKFTALPYSKSEISKSGLFGE